MKGKVTMTDLRLSMGLDDVEVYIVKKQLSYIGHLARYDQHQIESSIFGCSIEESARTNTQMSMMKQYWTRIQQVMSKQTTYEESEWPTSWVSIAQAENGELWRKLSAMVVEDLRQKCDSDTWMIRHSAENEARKEALQIVGETSDMRQVLCTNSMHGTPCEASRFMRGLATELRGLLSGNHAFTVGKCTRHLTG